MFSSGPISSRPISSIPAAAFSAPTVVPYLWRATVASLAIALAANAPPEYSQPKRQSWGYSVQAASGVIVGQAATQTVLVQNEPFRFSAQQSWPFGRATAAPPTSSQSFHLWYSPRKPTIEPEEWTQPTLFGFMVVGGEGPPPQPFSLWHKPNKPTIVVEEFSQPAKYQWTYAPVVAAQPTQPFSLWFKPTSASVTLDEFDRSVQYRWPYAPVVAAQPTQPFSLWFKPTAASVEVDSVAQATTYRWPYAPVAQPTQPFSLWFKSQATLTEDVADVVSRAAFWPFGRTYEIVSWNWWQIQPPATVPDTAQFYEYRSRNFGAEWRPFWITPTDPVVPVEPGSQGAFGGGSSTWDPKHWKRKRQEDRELEEDIRKIYRRLTLSGEPEIAKKVEAIVEVIEPQEVAVTSKKPTLLEKAEAELRAARLTLTKITVDKEIALRLLDQELKQKRRAENMRRIQLILQIA